MSTRRKRSPLGELGSEPKRQFTRNPSTTSQEDIQIAYKSSIPKQENPLNACITKMAEDTSDMKHYPDENITANQDGFNMIKCAEEIRSAWESIRNLQQEVEELRNLQPEVEELRKTQDLFKLHREKHLDLRQRAISTYVRDALQKESSARKEAVSILNATTIHGGDIHSDACVVTERFKPTSTERRSFDILYGLPPEEVLRLDQRKYRNTFQALDRGATVLLKNNLQRFKSDKISEARRDIVRLLLKENFSEAETKANDFLPDE